MKHDKMLTYQRAGHSQERYHTWTGGKLQGPCSLEYRTDLQNIKTNMQKYCISD